ncbi:MAG: type II toxin-antitoxin system RelE/ParE family toxin [Sulfurimonas sp.]|nr:type II toxin-antitoxin system RelE/ParE family toxin [Sulfurimonas sp.]MDQ7067067.1 type II toxin-antitoxin system RelE/ParE family toxin [Sulfurimonas sp.]
MIYKVIIEPEAFSDLINIKTYITKQDTLPKANQFISELKNSIKTLAEMPMRCRKSYYTDDENTHDLIYKKYTTVFKIIDYKVHVLTIFRQREY